MITSKDHVLKVVKAFTDMKARARKDVIARQLAEAKRVEKAALEVKTPTGS